MASETDTLLERLERKGSSALELLPTFHRRERDELWRQDPRLHRSFTRKLIAEGHPVRAVELAREGLNWHPGDQELQYLLALALARGGNVLAAENSLAERLKDPIKDPALQAEVLSLQGRLLKDRYARARDDAQKTDLAARSAAAYRKAADLGGADPFPYVNAATMSLLAGDSHEARALALMAKERASRDCHPGDNEDYWHLATLGEVCLVLNQLDEATTWYQKAVACASAKGDVGSIVSMRRNALLLRDKIDISSEILRLFYVGSVVVFAGHMLDRPSSGTGPRRPTRFPADPALIREVSQAIQVALNELNATIGFCSAACGSDILFAERVLERNSELHIVMPFARQDFYRTSVDFDSPEMRPWRARFDALLERATEVHYATTEAYLDDEVLFDFANRFMQGLTIIRAGQRGGTEPQALVVMDATIPGARGGTGSFLDRWLTGKHPYRMIDLASLREQVLGPTWTSSPAPAAPVDSTRPADRMERHVKAMLFADIKDFSKLREEYSPRFFVRFLEQVDSVLRSLQTAPIFRNTWGDGLYLVFETVRDCAEAALRLLESAEKVHWPELGLGELSPVRMGLHAGPVFSGRDPIIGRTNYFGSHVNRAARIEPVTLPGCAYASEQFASLLAAEGMDDYVCEYIGVESLAKAYDRCPLYRLGRR